MSRSFNLDGPCDSDEDYMIPASRRLGDEILDLIDKGKYFLLQAPRQTGKTTLLFDLVYRINRQGNRYAMLCNLEVLSGISDPEEGIRLLVKAIRQHARMFRLPNAEMLDRDFGDHVFALQNALSEYSESLDKPLVILFDEVDSLPADVLLPMLKQLRAGYIYRKIQPFVHSLALVGMRSLKDYRYDSNDPDLAVGNVSPFNITRPLVLRNFTAEEVAELYAQHTTETGQPFTQEAIDLAFTMTQGQPRLVNAIGNLTVTATSSDPATPISTQIVADAVQSLILSREMHIESLEDRLDEPRIQKILAPIIAGGRIRGKRGADYKYATDLGLIAEVDGNAQFANPIYAEVILRLLTADMQNEIKDDYPELVLSKFISNGEVLVDKLLTAFVDFWRENSEIWTKRWEYGESSPHIVMQAFMQRIVNGGAVLTRECAEGNGRLDIGIMYGVRRYPIELKVNRSSKSLDEAKAQILRYMDRMGTKTGWIMLFDTSKTLTWEQKVWVKTMKVKGKTIKIYGS